MGLNDFFGCSPACTFSGAVHINPAELHPGAGSLLAFQDVDAVYVSGMAAFSQSAISPGRLVDACSPFAHYNTHSFWLTWLLLITGTKIHVLERVLGAEGCHCGKPREPLLVAFWAYSAGTACHFQRHPLPFVASKGAVADWTRQPKAAAKECDDAMYPSRAKFHNMFLS